MSSSSYKTMKILVKIERNIDNIRKIDKNLRRWYKCYIL